MNKGVFFGLAAVLGIAIVFLLYFFMQNNRGSDYKLIEIWNAADGNLEQNLTPETNPTQMFTKAEAKLFVDKAIPAVMSFGFNDYEERRAENAPYLTKRGFVSVYEAIEKSGIRSMVEKNRAIGEAKISCITQINDKKDKYDRPLWVVELIMGYTYVGENKSLKLFQLTEVRLMNKKDESPKYQQGLGIRQLIVTASLSEEQAKEKCRSAS